MIMLDVKFCDYPALIGSQGMGKYRALDIFCLGFITNEHNGGRLPLCRRIRPIDAEAVLRKVIESIFEVTELNVAPNRKTAIKGALLLFILFDERLLILVSDIVMRVQHKTSRAVQDGINLPQRKMNYELINQIDICKMQKHM